MCIRDRGEAIDVIAVADYANLVANGVLTNEQTIAQEPELVEGFVRAFLRGLQDTLDDPDMAFETSRRFVEGLTDDRRGVLDASLALWRAEPLGRADPAAWQETHDLLLSMGLLDAPLDNIDALYTNEFVERAQP